MNALNETNITMPLPELQNWLICLDDHGTDLLIGNLVNEIESTPEMTITQFVESMKTLIAQEEAQ
jgi:hypothetical protein